MPEISKDTFGLYSKLIYSKSGILLTESKKELLKSRLQKRMIILGCDSFVKYYKVIIADKSGSELLMMLDAITTNKTDFFREIEHFKFLQRIVFPKLFAHKTRVNFWCAACSSGEEPYTLAMVIREFLPNVNDYNIKILATDLSLNILELAKSGLYSSSQITGVPVGLRQKYFAKTGTGTSSFYKVKQNIQDMVYFRWLNLMNNQYPFTGKFDVIFCRNVLIYFDPVSLKYVVDSLYSYLADSGSFFIGHSESLNNIDSGFVYVAPATYTKKQTQPLCK